MDGALLETFNLELCNLTSRVLVKRNTGGLRDFEVWGKDLINMIIRSPTESDWQVFKTIVSIVVPLFWHKPTK